MKRIAALLDDMNDVEKVLLPGLVLLSLGMALWWFPGALIAPGAVLIYAALRADPSAVAALANADEEHEE